MTGLKGANKISHTLDYRFQSSEPIKRITLQESDGGIRNISNNLTFGLKE